MMLGKEAEIVLVRSEEVARARGHEYICLEHLLYSLIEDDSVLKLVRQCGGDVSRLRNRIEEFFVNTLTSLPDTLPQQTIAFQRVLQRAIMHTAYSSARELKPADLLVAIFSEKDSHAVYFLSEEGISKLDLLMLVSHGQEEGPTFGSHDEMRGAAVSEEEGEMSQSQVLSRYTVDLLERARQGLIDPLIGREKEIAQLTEVLCRRQKNNPLLVGDQGVGKTAIVEGLALHIHEGRVPARLKDCRLFSLDLGGVLAGTKYRGDFEQRLKGIFNSLEELGNAILMIDEIHTVIGAGATSGGSLDLANLLKPALSSGKMRCIGSTTYDEYKRVFEKDRGLARRFLRIEVKEPSVEETLSILKGLVSRFEEHHMVKYSPSALQKAAQLSAQYINERFLPDKAIDVIDEAGAVVSLRSGGGRILAGRFPTVKGSDIEAVVARVAGIPTRSVTLSERERLQELPERLKEVVFGQDEAILEVIKSIRRSRSGLREDNKPVGCFLFTGPTGVGKTEVARQLASVLGLELLRFDMSEYMEKHSVARLIGAPPGYVGYDQGGLLTDSVIRHAHSVLLLDEIEKAHEDVYNILLQVMDNASLTDTNGRKADFRHVILIMTSNVGSESIHGKSIGFSNQSPVVGQGAIDRHFRPEFRNRLDAVVKFKPLSQDVIKRVVEKMLNQVRSQLDKNKVTLELSTEVIDHLTRDGYSPQFGARSISRLVQKEITDGLADALLFGPLSKGGSAHFVWEDGAVKLVVNSSSSKS